MAAPVKHFYDVNFFKSIESYTPVSQTGAVPGLKETYKAVKNDRHVDVVFPAALALLTEEYAEAVKLLSELDIGNRSNLLAHYLISKNGQEIFRNENIEKVGKIFNINFNEVMKKAISYKGSLLLLAKENTLDTFMYDEMYKELIKQFQGQKTIANEGKEEAPSLPAGASSSNSAT